MSRHMELLDSGLDMLTSNNRREARRPLLGTAGIQRLDDQIGVEMAEEGDGIPTGYLPTLRRRLDDPMHGRREAPVEKSG